MDELGTARTERGTDHGPQVSRMRAAARLHHGNCFADNIQHAAFPAAVHRRDKFPHRIVQQHGLTVSLLNQQTDSPLPGDYSVRIFILNISPNFFSKDDLVAVGLLHGDKMLNTETAFDPPPVAIGKKIARQVEIDIKYEGYIAKQQREIERLRNLERFRIPEDFDFGPVAGREGPRPSGGRLAATPADPG